MLSIINEVSYERCEDYDVGRVTQAIRLAVDGIGGFGRYIKPGQTVLVKPNMLAAVPAAEAVTTHPSVIRAVISLILETGASQVTVSDSPAMTSFARACDVTGIGQAAKEAGALLASMDEPVRKIVSFGKMSRVLELGKIVTDVDVVVNVSKLKTHGLTTFTGAVKNLYGCVPGKTKVEYHLHAPSPTEFAELLADVCMAVSPALNIMDGIIGMEGTGPRNGRPKQVGVLIASDNGFALDTFACRLIGLSPNEVAFLRVGQARGLVNLELDGILPDELAPIDGFNLGTARGDVINRVPKLFLRLLKNHLTPTPVVFDSACTGCAMCVAGCPPGALDVRKGKAHIDMSKCIRCYCCQELCGNAAIRTHEGWLLRSLFSRRMRT